MRWIFSSLLLLVLLLGAQALSPKMLEMKAFYESKMEVFSTLDEKEQLLVKTVGQFVAEVEEGKVASLSRTAQRDTAQRDTGFYADVQLENGEKFGVRQMAKVDVEQVITNFLSSQCLIPFCGTLIGGIIEVLLPDLVFLQSLNAEASAPSTQGSAALDLLIHLLTFPGSSGTLNSLLDQLLHVGVAPTTGLGYFEAKADYNLNFNAASLDLSAQAFAILQTYTRVIEFRDANSNKKYDEGEELSSISLSSAGWTATTYTSQQAASATVHTISSTTNDGVVGFTCETSTLPVQDSLSQIITPNATKCTITIENFPFTGTASQLAMEVFVGVFGANFDGSANAAISDFSLNVNSGPAGLQGGHFTWVPTVDVNGKSFAVSAEASAGASGGVVDFATSLLLKASGATEAQSMKVFFTFASSVNPSKVVWDPAIAYGDKPVLKSSAASLVPGSLFVLFATLLVFFF